MPAASSSPPLWQVWRNPIVRRYATARLRLFPVLGWSLVIQALGAFLWLAVYFSNRHHADIPHAALAAWTPILILQGILWLLKGTFSVAVGIAREGAEGLSECQRLTPLSAWHKVLGYLCGLPILETMLVASLLPWAMVSIVLGKIALLVVLRVYLLLTTAAVLHHCIGLVAGTVIRQKIVAGTVSQLLVITLHFIVPLFAKFGLGPLGHLGVELAIAAELYPSNLKAGRFSTVRFFDYDLSLTFYQWVVMATLIAFLLQILRRRWQRADAHLFSKPLTLAFSTWILVLSLGEILPAMQDGTLFDWGNKIARDSRRGSHALAAVSEALVPLCWISAFGCVALLVAMVLTAVMSPTLEEHGAARRASDGTPAPRLRWAADARSALAWTSILGLMSLAGWSILVRTSLATPVLRVMAEAKPHLPLILGAGLLVPLLTWAILLEWRGLKIACLGVFVCWIVPVMVGIVGMLDGADPTHWPRWCVSLSGFALPLYSVSQSLGGLGEFDDVLHKLRLPWLVSLGMHAAIAAVMLAYLRRAQQLSAKQGTGVTPEIDAFLTRES